MIILLIQKIVQLSWTVFPNYTATIAYHIKQLCDPKGGSITRSTVFQFLKNNVLQIYYTLKQTEKMQCTDFLCLLSNKQQSNSSRKGLWYLMPLSTIFQLSHRYRFYWWRKPKYLEKVTDKTNYDRTWWYLRMYRQSKCFSYSEIWKQMQSKWLYWLYYVLMFDIFLCRVKSFEFTKQGLTFEIPRLLTLSDCAYRVLDPKYDHYSPTCKSFYPRQKKKEGKATSREIIWYKVWPITYNGVI